MQTGGSGDRGGTGSAGVYRGLRSRGGIAAMGDINVTPLVDVVLVLLLVFMVTAPMMSRGIDVNLPSADQPQIAAENRLTVAIDVEGRTYVQDKPVHFQLLEDTIRDMVAGRPEKIVYLRADERLQYGRVIEVVDKLKKAGVDRIGFEYVLPQEKHRS